METISEEMLTLVFDRDDVQAALAAGIELDPGVGEEVMDADDLVEVVERITEDEIGREPLDASAFAEVLDEDLGDEEIGDDALVESSRDGTDPSVDLDAASEEAFLRTLPAATRAVLEAARQPARDWPHAPRIAFAVARPLRKSA